MEMKSLNLKNFAELTLKHYDERAEQFWEGTRHHDVTQNISALLQYIQGTSPYTILDFGCGPGRDLRTITDLGHAVVGLEGSEKFVEMAREQGYQVWQQNFLELDLPDNRFDGIFANASLFHVPSQELPRILKQLWATLKLGGVLFSSNPRGQNEEGWNGDRYGTYHDLDSWRSYMVGAGFDELTHYYRPEGLPLEQQNWLASVWRRNEQPTMPSTAGKEHRYER